MTVIAALFATAAPAFADSCPNAAFRQGPSANLPDCRAYELVTPSLGYGASANPFPGFSNTPSYVDGSHLLFSSLGAPGGPGANPTAQGAAFVATRTATGWVSSSIDPPASQYSWAYIIGGYQWGLQQLAGDFGSAFYGALPQGAKDPDTRLLLTRPGGGVQQIGPIAPPATVAAWTAPTGYGQGAADVPHINGTYASPDLSHVFFSLQPTNQQPGQIDWRWPGDTTGLSGNGQTLYEYSGVGNSAPTLVGLDNSGQLISECGTGLGDVNSGNMGSNATNPVSSDGSVVFFTAWGAADNPNCGAVRMPPVDELFARIDGSRTVAISEPSAADCNDCQLGSPADARFAGASSDGSKVFFTTTQALLPGDGDATTDVYLYDFNAPDGQKIIQVSAGGHGDLTPGSGAGVQGVATVSPDGSHVYFVATGVLTTDPNGVGRVAQAGQDNLYVYERDATYPNGRTAFVATLSPSDSSDWSESQYDQLETTPDGRFLMLGSVGDLTPDASGSGQQLYRYDAQTGQLVRVTIGENGFNGNGNTAGSFYFNPPLGGPLPGRARGISDDGSYVFFEGSGGLTPQALNDRPVDLFGDLALNVYEYHDGHVYLISDGRDATGGVLTGSSVALVGTNGSGSDVMFTTADPLVAADGNSAVDVYDARVDGGFPAGQGVPVCVGDACQGPLSPGPGAMAPGSVTYIGPSDLTGGSAPPRARLVRVLGRGRTVALRLSVPGPGRVRISAHGVRTFSRWLSRAGTYEIVARLTPRELRFLSHRRFVRLRLRVTFAPADARTWTQTTTVIDRRARR